MDGAARCASRHCCSNLERKAQAFGGHERVPERPVRKGRGKGTPGRSRPQSSSWSFDLDLKMSQGELRSSGHRSPHRRTGGTGDPDPTFL
eukprot:4135556-Pleurochrysis_carterae.AAC.1